MDRNQFRHNFLHALKEKIPRKSELAFRIAEILCIERESAYRRLRDDVYFSIDEMALLVLEFNISLDRILHNQNSTKYWRMNMPKFAETLEYEYELGEEVRNKVESICEQPDSCYEVVFTSLPAIIYYAYHEISKFFLFRWGYNFIRSEMYQYYANMENFARFFEQLQWYGRLVRRIGHICLICDEASFTKLVNDVCYFRDIELIRRNDIQKIKDELYQLLDDFESHAKNGKFEDTENKFEFYISMQSIDNGYSCLWSTEESLCCIGEMLVHSDKCNEREVWMVMRRWVDSMKRISTQISIVGEKDRILFFNRQRKIVELL